MLRIDESRRSQHGNALQYPADGICFQIAVRVGLDQFQPDELANGEPKQNSQTSFPTGFFSDAQWRVTTVRFVHRFLLPPGDRIADGFGYPPPDDGFLICGLIPKRTG